jgi:hypothetical protein
VKDPLDSLHNLLASALLNYLASVFYILSYSAMLLVSGLSNDLAAKALVL